MVELAKRQPWGTAAFVEVDFGEKTVTVSIGSVPQPNKGKQRKIINISRRKCSF